MSSGFRSALLTVALASLAGCHGGTAATGPTPPDGGTTGSTAPPAIPPVARHVSGMFLDAATGAPPTASLTVSVRDASGALSPLSLGAGGAAQNVFVTSSGVVSFAVDPAAPLPLKLKVVASADGYNSASADVVIAKDGAVDFSSSMVNVSVPPQGVAVAQAVAGSAASDGATAAPISVQTQASAASAGQVVVAVPEATVIQTADGRPLSGALQATVSYYSNAEPTALAAFPGGLDVSSVAQSNGSNQDGVFISGGFTAVQITDDKGNTAASFTKPLTVTVTVPAGTINPDTDQPVKAGDTIPFWSYSEITGQWKNEGDITLQDDGAGNFRADKPVSHLSYFNIDWFQQPCSTPDTVVITGNLANLPLDIELVATGGGFYKRHTTDPSDPNTISFINAGLPSGSREMKATAYYNGEAVGSQLIPNICGGQTLQLPVVLPDVRPATLTTSVVRVCRDDATRRAPIGSATVVVGLHSAGAKPAFGSTAADGTALFSSLASGLTYDVSYALVGGDFQATSMKLNPGANALELPVVTACDTPATAPVIPNRAPVVTSLVVPRPILLAGAAPMTLAASATDPDGDALSYAWSVSCTSGVVASLATPGAASTDVAVSGGAGTCTATLAVSDGSLGATRTATFTVSPGDRPPAIAALVVPRAKLVAGDAMTLSVDAADPDGDPLAYAWSASCTGAQATLLTPDLVSTRFQVTSGVGSCDVTVRVTANGVAVSRTATIEIAAIPDHPPVINAVTGPAGAITAGSTVALAVDASDPDGDALAYLWTVQCVGTVKPILAAPAAATTTFQAAAGSGSCTVAVKVTANALKATAALTFDVLPTPDHAPVINALTVPGSVMAGSSVTVSVDATDPDGDVLSYGWSASCTGAANVLLPSAGARSTQLQAISGPGSCIVGVTVSSNTPPLSATRTAIITVQPTPDRPPVIDKLTVPSTVSSVSATPVSVDASDPDGDPLAYQWTAQCTGNASASFAAPSVSSTQLQIASGSGTCTVGVRVTANGLAVARSITVAIPDRPPVIDGLTAPSTVPGGGSATLSMSASDPDRDALTYLWSVSCTGGAQATLGTPTAVSTPFQVISGSGSCDVTAQVSAHGLDASRSATITIADRPPVIGGITAPSSVVSGSTATVSVAASDPDGDALGYQWSQACTGTVKSTLGAPTSAAAQFQPTSGHGACTLTVVVTANGLTATQQTTITVPDRAPVIGAFTVPSSVVAGTSTQLSVAASDPDGDAISYAWTSSCGGTAAVSIATPSADTTPLLAVAGVGTCSISVVATANGLTASRAGSIDVLQAPDHRPVIGSFVAPSTLFAGAPTTLSVTATDADGDPLSYLWTATCTGTAAPSIASATTSTTGFVVTSGSGTCTVTVQVTANGATVSQGGTIAVPDRPPIISGVAAQSPVYVGGSETVSVSASDPDGDPLSYAWSLSCTGNAKATLGPSTSASAQFQVSSGHGSCTVTAQVTANGLSVSAPATIVVPDRPPVMQSFSAPDSIVTGGSATASAIASDPDGDAIAYQWTATCDPTAVLAIATPDVASTALQASGVGTCTLQVVATANGLTATKSQPVVVSPPPDRAPVIKALGLTRDGVAATSTNTGHAMTASVDAVDPDGDPLTYAWTASCTSPGLTVDFTAAGAATTNVLPTGGVGTCTLTVQVGARSLSDTRSVDFAVTADGAPMITDGPIGPNTLVSGDTTTSTTFAVAASDPDGDPLTYAWSSACVSGVKLDFADATAASTQVHAAAPGAGPCTVTVTVSANGASRSASMAVEVLASVLVQVDLTFVPRPLVTSVSLAPAAAPASLWTVQRSGPGSSNASYPGLAAPGTSWTGSFQMDPFAGPPATAADVTASCGAVANVRFDAATSSGSFEWAAPAVVPAPAYCFITVGLDRATLKDAFPIAVGVGNPLIQ